MLPRLFGARSIPPASRQLLGAAYARRWASTKLQLLEHHHLTGDGPGAIVTYSAAEAAQEDHRARFLAWKSLPDAQRSVADSPAPRLISFESAPTFTLGRRQDDLLPAQQARLERPLHIDLAQRSEPLDVSMKPDVRKTSRGGLTTYHGPGQLVLWPVIDMHSPLYVRYGVASYAAHLEATTRRLLSEVFGVQTYTTRDEPGVWAAGDGAQRKIAALGVHHRRYVTALGIAVNVDVPVVGGEDGNPWARFVPCGLEGKLATSVAAEMGPRADGVRWNIAELAARWAVIFEEGLLDAAKRGDEAESGLL